MENIKDICKAGEDRHGFFKAATDKSPLSYTLGEDIHFTFTLCDENGERLSCPKIKYTARIDGEGEKAITEFADGCDGVLELTLKPLMAGFVYVRVNACDGDGNVLPNVETCNSGAGANVDEIRPVLPEPADFDAFWNDTVKLLSDVPPDVLEFEKLDPEKYGFEPEKYTAYHVRVASVDGEYAAGFLSIPFDAKEGECALRLDFQGYGVGNSFGKYVPKTIVFDVIAHSIPANLSKEQLAEVSESDTLKNYGIWGDPRNNDRNTVYFRNMILRDLQAAKFLMSYFSSDKGGRLWDGKTIGTRGGSQGAFQATAVAALLPVISKVEPSFLIFNMPWLCDVGTANFGNRYKSDFFPEYTDALRYYDTTSFARRVHCPAEGGETGLGDTCAIPSATMSYFNFLSSQKGQKSIRYFQNGVHGGHGRFFEEFLIER